MEEELADFDVALPGGEMERGVSRAGVVRHIDGANLGLDRYLCTVDWATKYHKKAAPDH